MMMGIITAVILWISGSSFSASSPQYIAQQPTFQFRSTSQMQPAPTSWGEKRTYAQPFSADAPGSYNSSPKRSRRALGGDDDDIDPPYGGDGPGDPGMDETTPVGDIPWLMMLLLAAAYIAYTTYSTRKRKASADFG